MLDAHRTLKSTHHNSLNLLGLAFSLFVFELAGFYHLLRSLKEAHPEAMQAFEVPSQFNLLLFGALAASMVVAMYLPAQRSIVALGNKAVDVAVASASEKSATSASSEVQADSDALDRLRQRIEYQGLIGPESGLWESLQKSVVALSPLLTSAFSLLLNGTTL
jgi:hypothetical protein